MEISMLTGIEGDEYRIWIRPGWEEAHPIELRIGPPGERAPASRRTTLSVSMARQLAYLLLAAAEEAEQY